MLTQIGVGVLLLLDKSPELSPGQCQGVGRLSVLLLLLLLTAGPSGSQPVLTLPPTNTQGAVTCTGCTLHINVLHINWKFY